MDSKRRHHFVPRFYLKAFASAPRRINVFNLPRLEPIKDVSLRDQCYRHRLYGPSGEVEEAFARVESVVAPVLARFRSGESIKFGRASSEAVVNFVALQLQRTEAAIARVRTMYEALGAAAFDGRPPPSFVVEEQRALTILLSVLPEIANALEDLKLQILHAPPDVKFITSDHPITKFNHYCEGTRDVGVLGADCRGLEIALPLSPDVAVILYDGDVYRARDLGSRHVLCTTADVDCLNRLAVIESRENLYFSRWHDAASISTLVATTTQRKQIHVAMADDEEDPNHGIIAVNEVLPDVPTALSSLEVRRGAARTPWQDRIHSFRHRVGPSAEIIPSGHRIPGAQRFVVREHRYVALAPTRGSRIAPSATS